MTYYTDVRAFHEACDIPVADKPTALSLDRLLLRLRLIAEEVGELVAEMTGQGPTGTSILQERLAQIFAFQASLGTDYYRSQPDHLARIAKELADVHVVVSGTSVEYGLDEDWVWPVVHASNMAKADGPVREDGKRLKPEGWKAPDVAGALQP